MYMSITAVLDGTMPPRDPFDKYNNFFNSSASRAEQN